MLIADAGGLGQLPPWSVGIPEPAVSNYLPSHDNPAADSLGGVFCPLDLR
jgi:hypothetical protein